MISLKRSWHVPIHIVLESVAVAKAVVHSVFVASAVVAVVHASPDPLFPSSQRVLSNEE